MLKQGCRDPDSDLILIQYRNFVDPNPVSRANKKMKMKGLNSIYSKFALFIFIHERQEIVQTYYKKFPFNLNCTNNFIYPAMLFKLCYREHSTWLSFGRIDNTCT
jgi:hypothetical protein